MGFRLWAGIVVAASLAAFPFDASAQEATDGPLFVRHPVLIASAERLAAESASWRAALSAVAATGRRAVVVTPDAIDGFDSERLAQVRPIVDEQSQVGAVVVVVNLALMQRLSGLPVRAVDFEADLDRILAHEIYGHAIPLLLAGSMAGNCADPDSGQPALDACAIRRENVIRKEMGLGQRVGYGREGLALARAGRNR